MEVINRQGFFVHSKLKILPYVYGEFGAIFMYLANKVPWEEVGIILYMTNVFQLFICLLMCSFEGGEATCKWSHYFCKT